MTVRVRFSPAPTGYLHVGSARAALFNWLYARHTGGTFVLRIEDTDADRSTSEHVEAIGRHLESLGLDWDEEYRQSERFDLYRRVAAEMVDNGYAYRCDCSQEAVKERTAAAAAAAGVSDAGGYDGHCRDRDVQPGEGVVVRFRTPTDGVTGWDDVIRGRVEFENALLEDFVIVRSTGVPMFHVANAYDDLDMGITHVVRGEDLVNTTPRVLLLRQAMGADDQPVYAHLPLIVNEQRKKLSKRRDDVSVGDYLDRGYLPEAMRNYLVTLGWGAKDGVEIRPIEEIIEQFDLVDINKAPAFFDVKKLDHFNAEHIRQLDVDDFVAKTRPWVDAADPAIPADLFERMAPLVQQRVRRLEEAPSFLDWVVGEAPEPVAKDWRKVMGAQGVADVLDGVVERLADVEWTPEALEKAVFGVGEELGRKSQLPVRMAVSGSRSGLPLFEPMAEVDRGVILDRLRAARAKL
ncbi:MAG: glutamate--tRNA ligase [Actinomycetia bacterium]|nr:glutamate--tRNA ligase [Actinomycetes bacterium]MCP4225455.1 glutamate--tRNA ligase [Actinomycetes bacterium]MCP5031559.1 glutamate--tRNA ligase [Actinomycetes bacterium]